MWGALSLVFTLIFIAGCTTKESTTTTSATGPYMQGPAETSYCSSALSYSGSTTTVSGTAQYKKRGITGSGLGTAAAASSMPIRRAEVRVTDSAGTVYQCATTDNSGAFSFVLPQGSTTYTIYVNSRASNSYLVASVLDKTDTNRFYSLTTTVTPTGATANVGTLTAGASGTTLGGAFNILDQLLNANEYLRTQVSNCSASFTGCSNFSIGSKVTAYWTVGFNPNSYFGAPTSGLSFYLPSCSRLFILGGINGDTDSSDTDHYDDSVIIHEYGHFLEDTVFVSDSPGGSHNGNRIIDPRLAWSEGWGNFFQAAVRGDAHYIDTMGNGDGTASLAYYADLETADRDVPSEQGEGNFREFSVTRLLWDVIDNTPAETLHAGTDNISGKFPEIWAAITKTSQGFKDSNYAFRNIGLLHYAQQQLGGGSNWSGPRLIEYQDGNTGEYAQYVTATGAPCTYTITPDFSSGKNVGLSHASYNMFKNNNFYHYKSPGGAHTVQIVYSSGSTTTDLDLYVYNEDASFFDSSDIIGRADTTPSGGAPSETIGGLSMPSGNYLIDVRAYTAAGAQTYTLKIDGAYLCPASL